ncbi:hypothetical protein LEP1GSC052_3294 [Leptospira kmetyi serovar Malaysia str. Bejo-Iso9]|nr:hypothetical protein LEP1GSC052_3294 [Leptospira kmetyi serovar Malaysia str. Bejo-Iso9]
MFVISKGLDFLRAILYSPSGKSKIKKPDLCKSGFLNILRLRTETVRFL